MMHAVKKFDPERGFRLATYAMWWIKAAIQEFVLRSWSQVKLGTTASQKKLFFNLRKIKNKIVYKKILYLNVKISLDRHYILKQLHFNIQFQKNKCILILIYPMILKI